MRTDNQGNGFVRTMQHSVVLNVRSLADPDGVHISADDGSVPHVAVFPNLHIIDNASTVGYKNTRMYPPRDAGL